MKNSNMKNIVDVLSLQNRVQENKQQKVKPTDYRLMRCKTCLKLSNLNIIKLITEKMTNLVLWHDFYLNVLLSCE